MELKLLSKTHVKQLFLAILVKISKEHIDSTDQKASRNCLDNTFPDAQFFRQERDKRRE